MEEHALNGEYISVLRNGVLSYGGSQRWLDSGALRQCGCGVIAALDLLLYLRQQRTDCRWLPVSSWGRPYRLGREEFDCCRRGGQRLPAVHDIGREGEIGMLIIPGIPGRDPVCLEFCGVTPAAPSRPPARRTEPGRCSPARGSSCPRRRSSAG